MAKAEKRHEEYTVTLEMTRSEAEFLHQLTEKVAGSPYQSARKFADAIGKALRDADVLCASHRVNKDYTGVVYFEDFA